MRGRTILVTGGAGFIGSAVVRHLIANTAWNVVNVDKLSYASSTQTLMSAGGPPRHIFVKADIRDVVTMGQLMAEHQPEAILHLAAETHVDRSIDDPGPFVENNLVGTYQLLEAARLYWQTLPMEERTSFRFVQVSTDEVFGSLAKDDPPFNQFSAYAPRSPYSASKAGADHLARAWGHTYGLPVIVTNCSNNYGPFQFPEKLIPTMLIKGMRGEPMPVYGDGSNIRDWLYVDDHAQALVAAVEHGQAGQTYLIGGDAECSNLDLVRTICAELDKQAPDPLGSHERLIQMVEDRPGHDFRYAIDAKTSHEGLTWSPLVDFAEGIRHTVAWYLKHQRWWETALAGSYDGRRLGLKGNSPPNL